MSSRTKKQDEVSMSRLVKGSGRSISWLGGGHMPMLFLPGKRDKNYLSIFSYSDR